MKRKGNWRESPLRLCNATLPIMPGRPRCLLADPELESVALARMEGYTVEEIAAKLKKHPRSVKRKLHLIRALWEKEVQT